jgi:hypothetical protein
MAALLDAHETPMLPAEAQRELRRILAARTEYAPDDPRIERVFRHPWKDR